MQRKHFLVLLIVSFLVLTVLILRPTSDHDRKEPEVFAQELRLSDKPLTCFTDRRPRTVFRSVGPHNYSLFPKFYGQANEDKIMLDYFLKSDGTYLRNGVFIEIGALDGLKLSNSKVYEEVLGWSGLLVEPTPNVFQQLLKNRPNERAYKSNAAVCLKEGEIEMIGTNEMAGRVDTLDEVHERTWSGAKRWKIQCGPMSKYVREAGLKRVDFFSLDVEGGEYDVLQTFPWDTVPVYAILVELNGREASKQKDSLCRQLLSQKGFIYVKNFGHGQFNELWINPDNVHPDLH